MNAKLLAAKPIAATAHLVLVACLLTACGAAPGSSEAKAETVYQEGPSSRGGTGRYYMDREIAHVMSYHGADWLERPERQMEERTDLSVEKLPLESDSIVADIGAGSGYFSRRIAERVVDGSVYAVDIQPEMLAILEQNALDAGIKNIQPVLADELSLNLPPGSIDLAIFVDVYHELSWPKEVMADLKNSLKPGGKVVLLEYRAEDPSIPIIPVHKMTSDQAVRELEAAGFEFVENQDFLPRQHFLVFRKPDAS